jgi:hypothetical protein
MIRLLFDIFAMASCPYFDCQRLLPSAAAIAAATSAYAAASATLILPSLPLTPFSPTPPITLTPLIASHYFRQRCDIDIIAADADCHAAIDYAAFAPLPLPFACCRRAAIATPFCRC